ncbi:nucleotidyltransferase domain-containing protein [Erythrobacter ani]|uniref:Nucleotidyltransferase domain-containing protein n=1 Tax=Erythrobacter ani TaxID=2827235 RepID=A0ABS6SJF8_9SPHN|nr:nucleotidyltransferase domain-containing protein [Erythrobacter ani]MBV7265159.1 nucleotidyltransferase domain-containing protein [Erythrobacter ani]
MTNIPSEVRADIEARLARVASEDGVRLLMAVESGSRGWGFPSPDSDYDVRFLYIRPRRDYLALKPVRDVVERPIVDEIDLNGWDLRKALGLMLKHNAVVSEWIESPIRYIADDPVVEQLAAFANRHFNPRGYALHYASLGKGTVGRWLGPDGEIAVKRYFYALRPALSVRALRLDPSRRPPMSMVPLMQAADLDRVLVDQVDELIVRKAITREAGNTIGLPDIERLVVSELERAGEVPERKENTNFAEEAEALFIELVEKE